MKKYLLLFSVLIQLTAISQKKFAQLDQELPTPNDYRTASGAPGHEYYQQQADAQMQSVDNTYMRENDPRMPMFKERKSTVTFGKGL
jgi:hypothetical protein